MSFTYYININWNGYCIIRTRLDAIVKQCIRLREKLQIVPMSFFLEIRRKSVHDMAPMHETIPATVRCSRVIDSIRT